MPEITSENLTVYISIISACSAILGAIFGSLGSLGVAYINKKSEERKYIYDLTIKAATENWKMVHSAAKSFGATVSPMKHFIIQMSFVLNRTIGKNLSKQEIEKILKESLDIARAMEGYSINPLEDKKKKSQAEPAGGADAVR